MSTHTGVATTSLGVLELVKLPTPTPGPDEVLINVHYAALIPFDGYQLDQGYALSPGDYPRVLGFASAGLVKAVGENVKDLKEGDRVAAMNFPETKNKAAQEYTVVPRALVAKIPESVPLHEAASIPDNYATAMYTVFASPTLALPVPSSLLPPSVSAPDRTPVDTSLPVLVYGAGASSGQYLVQAFRLAGFTEIFAVASARHHALLRTLGATQCFDYRDADVAAQIRRAVQAAPGGRFAAAADIVGARSSLAILSDVFTGLPAAAGGARARLAVLAPFKDGDTVTNAPGTQMHFAAPAWVEELFAPAKDAVEVVPVYTFQILADAFAGPNVLPVLLPRLLETGQIRPNAVKLMKEGSLLNRVNTGLDLLRNNKVSGEKIVVELQASS